MNEKIVKFERMNAFQVGEILRNSSIELTISQVPSIFENHLVGLFGNNTIKSYDSNIKLFPIFRLEKDVLLLKRNPSNNLIYAIGSYNIDKNLLTLGCKRNECKDSIQNFTKKEELFEQFVTNVKENNYFFSSSGGISLSNPQKLRRFERIFDVTFNTSQRIQEITNKTNLQFYNCGTHLITYHGWKTLYCYDEWYNQYLTVYFPFALSERPFVRVFGEYTFDDDFFHPHVSSSGNCCLGEHTGRLFKAQNQGDVPIALLLDHFVSNWTEADCYATYRDDTLEDRRNAYDRFRESYNIGDFDEDITYEDYTDIESLMSDYEDIFDSVNETVWENFSDSLDIGEYDSEYSYWNYDTVEQFVRDNPSVICLDFESNREILPYYPCDRCDMVKTCTNELFIQNKTAILRRIETRKVISSKKLFVYVTGYVNDLFYSTTSINSNDKVSGLRFNLSFPRVLTPMDIVVNHIFQLNHLPIDRLNEFLSFIDDFIENHKCNNFDGSEYIYIDEKREFSNILDIKRQLEIEISTRTKRNLLAVKEET